MATATSTEPATPPDKGSVCPRRMCLEGALYTHRETSLRRTQLQHRRGAREPGTRAKQGKPHTKATCGAIPSLGSTEAEGCGAVITQGPVGVDGRSQDSQAWAPGQRPAHARLPPPHPACLGGADSHSVLCWQHRTGPLPQRPTRDGQRPQQLPTHGTLTFQPEFLPRWKTALSGSAPC